MRIKIIRQVKQIINKILGRLPYGMYRAITTKYDDMVIVDKTQRYRLAFFHRAKIGARDKYYIFRFQMPDYMLFAAAIQYIFCYAWAHSKGFIPVIDMEQEYDFKQGRLGIANLWDSCFEQEISVGEALKKDYVFVEAIGGVARDTIDNLKINPEEGDHWIHVTMDADWREYYANINKKIDKCWKFKPEIISFYETHYGKKIKDGTVVLGVALREEFSKEVTSHFDETAAKVAANHPSIIGIKETVELVKQYMVMWSADKIFLSTEMEESVDEFVKVFGERVVYVDRKRRDRNVIIEGSKTWGENLEERYNSFQQKGGEKYFQDVTIPYVYEVLGLSECDYFIGAKASGSAAALVLNGGKYKDIYILPDANSIKRY